MFDDDDNDDDDGDDDDKDNVDDDDNDYDDIDDDYNDDDDLIFFSTRNPNAANIYHLSSCTGWKQRAGQCDMNFLLI
jgi:hypothetical protein